MSKEKRMQLQDLFINTMTQRTLETDMNIRTTDDILDAMEDIRRTAVMMEDGELILFANKHCFNGEVVA